MAVPSVRRKAREFGIDLTGLSGSGRRGRIRLEDLSSAAVPATTVAGARIGIRLLQQVLPRIAAASGEALVELMPFVLKAAAAALEARPDLSPLTVRCGDEQWRLGSTGPLRPLGLSSLRTTLEQARAPKDAPHHGPLLELIGPVAVDTDDESFLHATLQTAGDDRAAQAFLRSLSAMIESPAGVMAA